MRAMLKSRLPADHPSDFTAADLSDLGEVAEAGRDRLKAFFPRAAEVVGESAREGRPSATPASSAAPEAANRGDTFDIDLAPMLRRAMQAATGQDAALQGLQAPSAAPGSAEPVPSDASATIPAATNSANPASASGLAAAAAQAMQATATGGPAAIPRPARQASVTLPGDDTAWQTLKALMKAIYNAIMRVLRAVAAVLGGRVSAPSADELTAQQLTGEAPVKTQFQDQREQSPGERQAESDRPLAQLSPTAKAAAIHRATTEAERLISDAAQQCRSQMEGQSEEAISRAIEEKVQEIAGGIESDTEKYSGRILEILEQITARHAGKYCQCHITQMMNSPRAPLVATDEELREYRDLHSKLAHSKELLAALRDAPAEMPARALSAQTEAASTSGEALQQEEEEELRRPRMR